MTIEQLLRHASAMLRNAGIKSHRLDAEILLAFVLGRERIYLHAHGEKIVSDDKMTTFYQTLVEQRSQRRPISYLLGRKEFYGHSFIVTPDTLIPRPETETLVEQVLFLPLQPGDSVLDVGTGSAPIAASIQLTRPDLKVYATDISPAALKVARQNATNLGAKITFAESDLLASSPITSPSCIVANLPYVDPVWDRSPETNFEPALALFADDGGLSLILRLIAQASTAQVSRSYLALEADPEQHDRIATQAQGAGYREISRKDYAIIFQKN